MATRRRPDGLVTLTEAADILGVARSHVYRLIHRGKLTPMRDPLHAKGGPAWLERATVERVRADLGRWVTDDEPVAVG